MPIQRITIHMEGEVFILALLSVGEIIGNLTGIVKNAISETMLDTLEHNLLCTKGPCTTTSTSQAFFLKSNYSRCKEQTSNYSQCHNQSLFYPIEAMIPS